ncbi:hypothetical protein QQ056_19750 [Oscillatoria laete-virens NRMC-F 0139]|nr:hypothetical protein [Oscillatoria laete-virens NRMC-F 0139]
MKKIAIGCLGIAVLLAMVLGIGIALITTQPVRLVFKNESSKELKSVTVVVAEDQIEFGSFAPRSQKSEWFLHDGRDAGYKVTCITVTGEKFEEESGYLTSGMILHTTYIEFRNGDEIFIKDY